ncbi:MAG: tetratricopeptide repeat protein [Magnetococcales bacterium]|nr:tetratricopeptide repeat protein [Magnetococcales bacterium]
MDTLTELDRAIDHHTHGRLSEAREMYRRVLRKNPRQHDALHLSGVLALQTGDPVAAIHLIGTAVAIRPEFAEAHCHLGLACQAVGQNEEALRHFHESTRHKARFPDPWFHRGNLLAELGRSEEALAAYSHAVSLAPQWAEAHYNLGNTFVTLQRWPEAEASYLRAVVAKPDFAAAWFNRGLTLGTLGRHEEALHSLFRGLSLEPDNAGGHNGLGNTLLELGRLEEAVAAYRRAMALDPALIDAVYNLGRVHALRQALDEAVACYRAALALDPGFAPALYNMGNTLSRLGRLKEAQEAYREAIRHRPDYAEAWYNLGNTLREDSRFDEAFESYRAALRIRPDFAEAHFGIAVLELLRGNFIQGWPLYEWRFKKQDFPPHEHHQPLWNGQRIPGMTLLVHCEQGLGDGIQFIRHLPWVKDSSAARVVLLCPESLRRLFVSMRGIDLLVTAPEEVPSCQYQVPLMSLPYLQGKDWIPIPEGIPYLVAPVAEVERFRAEISSVDRPCIGIAWRGSATHGNDSIRSMDPQWLLPLHKLHGVRLFSLQKEVSPGDREVLAGWDGFFAFEERLTDMAATAGLMVHLDLVIAVDTSVIHLAGALGCRAWLLLPHVPDWRWMLDRSDSPWYPDLRLFRQAERGDWGGVMAAVVDAAKEQFI